jgi:hypothetical protein
VIIRSVVFHRDHALGAEHFNALVSALTSILSRRARETAECEKLAARAMSLIDTSSDVGMRGLPNPSVKKA